MRRILVIDDSPEICYICQEILVDAGYEVFAAADGKEGLKLFKANSPHLVITDIIMPEQEGIETIMELRRNHPEVKIIAMSGGGQAAVGSVCLALAKQLGADRTLSKPFSRNDLLTAVAEVLGLEVRLS